MKLSHNIFSVLFLIFLFAIVSSVRAEIVVITNKATKLHGITLAEVRELYLGKNKSLSNGQRLVAADQAMGTDIHKQFYKKVLGMTENELSRYWAKRRVTRKFKPPKIIIGDIAMKQWIAITPDNIGYIDSKSLDSSVKVLLIIP